MNNIHFKPLSPQVRFLVVLLILLPGCSSILRQKPENLHKMSGIACKPKGVSVFSNFKFDLCCGLTFFTDSHPVNCTLHDWYQNINAISWETYKKKTAIFYWSMFINVFFSFLLPLLPLYAPKKDLHCGISY